MFADSFRNRHKNYASFLQLILKGRRHRNGIKDSIHCNFFLFAFGMRTRLSRTTARSLDTEQNLGFTQGNTELFKICENFRRDVVNRLIFRTGRRLGIVICVLVINLRIIDHRPSRLFHGQPTAKSVQSPLQQPFWFFFFCRDIAHCVFIQTFWCLYRFNVRREPVFIGFE